MKATPKAPVIDQVLSSLTGRDRQECVARRICMTCGAQVAFLRDEASLEEFRISGMCQQCQDEVFADA